MQSRQSLHAWVARRGVLRGDAAHGLHAGKQVRASLTPPNVMIFAVHFPLVMVNRVTSSPLGSVP
jgi:hypothetical protein